MIWRLIILSPGRNAVHVHELLILCSCILFKTLFFFQDNTEAILDCLFVSFSSKYLIGGLLLPCSDQIEIVLHLPSISSLLTILAVYKLISFYIVVAFTQ